MALVRPGEGEQVVYAGEPFQFAASNGPWAVAEMSLPAGFRGQPPHVHDGFDEGIYVLEGRIIASVDRDEPAEAVPGAMLVAPRGTRHFFSNPFDEPARVLAIWSPADAGVDFMRAIGAALPASGLPDPDLLRQLYEQHGSRLDP